MRLHHLLPALSISLHLASSLPTCPFDICPAPSTPPAICGTAPVSPLGRRRDVAVARTTPLCCWLSGTANHALVNGIPSPVFYLPAGTYMISWANFFLVGAASEAIGECVFFFVARYSLSCVPWPCHLFEAIGLFTFAFAFCHFCPMGRESVCVKSWKGRVI